jgi:hypothetical protein
MKLGRVHPITAWPSVAHLVPAGACTKNSKWTPDCTSVNDGIQTIEGELRYEPFEAALSEVVKLGRGTIIMEWTILCKCLPSFRPLDSILL